ncbi:MAG TPA: hypothetical protein VFS05_01745 [Gemmatimonadaceae bacterium]|nr:hypothetical protein [Gemmatimonadaceae bacterium]
MQRLALASVLLAGLAAGALGFGRPAPAGPPWISIEYPPSPYDQETRDAFLLVHAFHHGTPSSFPVSGTAEGIVRGQRRSVRLDFGTTSRVGTYALRRQWPTEGTWTLVISVAQAPEDLATAVVELGTDGRVASVRVPTEARRGWEVPAARGATMREVDASLRARAGALARTP